MTGSCEQRITIAAAGTKPTSSGSDMKYASTPARSRPTARRIRPTIRASSRPSWTYGVLNGVAIVLSAAKVSRAETAVGPGWRYGDDPNGADATGGTAAA